MTDPIALCLAGELSPPVALARAILSGESPSSLRRRIAGRTEQTAVVLRRLLATDLAPLRDAAAAFGAHESRSLDAIRDAYDRAVVQSPEAAVAAYSLGSPALLAQATAEVVGWLRCAVPVVGARVLDLGCGIGRIADALKEARVVGTDVSFAMLREARRRLGRDAALVQTEAALPFAAGVFDVVLAVDAFPYIVLAGEADRTMAEIIRVLDARGRVVILNLSYRELEADRADAARWAARYGLDVDMSGERPFTLWDGAAFVLQKAAG